MGLHSLVMKKLASIVNPLQKYLWLFYVIIAICYPPKIVLFLKTYLRCYPRDFTHSFCIQKFIQISRDVFLFLSVANLKIKWEGDNGGSIKMLIYWTSRFQVTKCRKAMCPYFLFFIKIGTILIFCCQASSRCCQLRLAGLFTCFGTVLYLIQKSKNNCIML